MNGNKVVKIISWIVGLLFCLLVVLGILLFLALPSPYKVKEAIFAKKQVQAQSRQSQKSSAPVSTRNQNTNQENTDFSNSIKPTHRENSIRLFRILTDETKPLSTACGSLSKKQSRQMSQMNIQEFVKRFESMLENDPGDTRLESIKPILKFTLIQPNIRDVITKVEHAENKSALDLMSEKSEFYYSIYDAYKEMVANKEKMEHILNQSYLTMMMGRAVEANPQLIADSRLIEYCEQVETILNTDAPIDFAAEKRGFAEFLVQAGVDPNKISFDPKYETHLEVVFNAQGLHFHGGWIDEIFSPLERELTKK